MSESAIQTVDLHILARAEFKANGYVLWGIQSGEKRYQVSCNLKHQVTGCEQQNGEPCLGWKYNRKCKHTTLVQEREYEREAQERAAYDALFDPNGFEL